MPLQYGLDEKVPFLRNLLFGMQWAVLLISTIIILGKVVGLIQCTDQFSQILYLRKLLILSSVTLAIQIFWGHKLPLILGPSAVLLIGIIASISFSVSVIYTSIMAGGIILMILSIGDVLKYVNRFFTANVISVVLILIAFTMLPAIMDLIIDKKSGVNPSYNICFAIIIIFAMFIFYRLLKGIWRSTVVIWGIVLGSIAYYFIFDTVNSDFNYEGPWVDSVLHNFNTNLSFHPGVMISFLFCFMALLINDLGSIQSVNEILEVKDRVPRIKRGVFVTGLANLSAGFMGVIGPVNFSISPGLILSTDNNVCDGISSTSDRSYEQYSFRSHRIGSGISYGFPDIIRAYRSLQGYGRERVWGGKGDSNRGFHFFRHSRNIFARYCYRQYFTCLKTCSCQRFCNWCNKCGFNG